MGINCFCSLTETVVSRRSNNDGIDGPWMSASRSPTLNPRSASPCAIYATTVDLPTPPLQEETAMMDFTASSVVSVLCGGVKDASSLFPIHRQGGQRHAGRHSCRGIANSSSQPEIDLSSGRTSGPTRPPWPEFRAQDYSL